MKKEVVEFRKVLDSILPIVVVKYIILPYVIRNCESCSLRLEDETLSILAKDKRLGDICEPCLIKHNAVIYPWYATLGSPLSIFKYAKHSFPCRDCGKRVACDARYFGGPSCRTCRDHPTKRRKTISM